MGQSSVTCIIPFYNEGERLYSVLEAVGKVGGLSEVICVDDCSFVDLSGVVGRTYPWVRYLRLPKNLGKTGAVREGVRRAHGDLIFLLDADLRDLDPKELEEAVRVMEDPFLDLLILRRIRASWVVRLVRGDVLFSGERILRKRDLEQICSAPIRNWELEAAINAWMLERGKRVVWMPYSATNTHKHEKMGLWEALRDDLATRKDILTSARGGRFSAPAALLCQGTGTRGQGSPKRCGDLEGLPRRLVL